jgi:hypothetical protein
MATMKDDDHKQSQFDACITLSTITSKLETCLSNQNSVRETEKFHQSLQDVDVNDTIHVNL